MTNALYVTSLVAVGVLVVALAVTLLVVAYLLAKTRRSLVDVAAAIRTIADRAEPIGPYLTEVNAELAAVREAIVAVAPPADAGTSGAGTAASPAGSGSGAAST